MVSTRNSQWSAPAGDAQAARPSFARVRSLRSPRDLRCVSHPPALAPRVRGVCGCVSAPTICGGPRLAARARGGERKGGGIPPIVCSSNLPNRTRHVDLDSSLLTLHRPGQFSAASHLTLSPLRWCNVAFEFAEIDWMDPNLHRASNGSPRVRIEACGRVNRLESWAVTRADRQAARRRITRSGLATSLCAEAHGWAKPSSRDAASEIDAPAGTFTRRPERPPRWLDAKGPLIEEEAP